MIIAITNRKGGVGKTTTAQAVAAALSRKGFKVLAADLDSQANLTYSYGASENSPHNSYTLLIGKSSAADAVQTTPNGDIIASSEELAMICDSVQLEALREALKPIKKKYDHIVIDTAPSLNKLTGTALAAADRALIVAQADIYSIKAIMQISETVNACKKINKGLKISGILLTRHNQRAIHSKDITGMAETVAAKLSTTVYEAKIRECIAAREAQTAQQNIFDYAPNSNAAQDYGAFMEEFIRKEGLKV